MKEKWEKPKIRTIGIESTESGGKDRMNADCIWTTYDSEGNPEDHITYAKKNS